MNHITQERLANLSDFIFCKNLTDFKITKPCHCLTRNSIVYTNYLDYSSVFFITSNVFDLFFSRIYPLMKHPFVIITSYSEVFDKNKKKYQNYLNSPLLKRWYCQNILLNHEKIVPVPINLSLGLPIKRELPKELLTVYPSKKTIFSENIESCFQQDKINKLSTSFFVLIEDIKYTSIWECLFFGAIPIIIIPNNLVHSIPIIIRDNNLVHSSLPVLVIDSKNVSGLNLGKLSSLKDDFKTLKRDYFDFNFWQERINSERIKSYSWKNKSSNPLDLKLLNLFSKKTDGFFVEVNSFDLSFVKLFSSQFNWTGLNLLPRDNWVKEINSLNRKIDLLSITTEESLDLTKINFNLHRPTFIVIACYKKDIDTHKTFMSQNYYILKSNLNNSRDNELGLFLFQSNRTFEGIVEKIKKFDPVKLLNWYKNKNFVSKYLEEQRKIVDILLENERLNINRELQEIYKTNFRFEGETKLENYLFHSGTPRLKLETVLSGCTVGDKYSGCIPIFIQTWLHFYPGIKIVIVLISKEIPEKLKKYREHIHLFPPIEGVSSVYLAQNIRLFYPGLLSGSGVVITDIDIVPMNSYYFKTCQVFSEENFVSYRKDFVWQGMRQVPICYNIATPKVWSEIFRVKSISDVRKKLIQNYTKSYDGKVDGKFSPWYQDQVILHRQIGQWKNNNNRVFIGDNITRFKRLRRMDNIRPTQKLKNEIDSGFYSDYHIKLPIESNMINEFIFMFHKDGK